MSTLHVNVDAMAYHARERLLDRNAVFETFFMSEAPRLAEASHQMSRRFLDGGRLLAFGSGAASTDAQHVSVEFVHPVIVGKRALPAIDLGPEFVSHLPVMIEPQDMAMGFAFSSGESAIAQALHNARERGALTFALAGADADYSFDRPSDDPFICQEVFEVLYHLLWETVHVYFEHREQGRDVGASAFLYPFLGTSQQNVEGVVKHVEDSMLQKMRELNRIRTEAAETQADAISRVAAQIHTRLQRGGKIVVFGNGGSATDANDFAIDCVAPPKGIQPIPAISLSTEPAIITAVANDVGSESIYIRQLIAHNRPNDIAIGISTSGSSPNILSALGEARKRGLLTIGIAGYDGGRIKSDQLADETLVVHSDYIPRIQEAQASVYHTIRMCLDDCGREAATYA